MKSIKWFSKFWSVFRTKKLGMLGLLTIIFSVFIAIFADFLKPYPTKVTEGDLSAILESPSLNHILGTDDVGRDIVSLLIDGVRVSLIVGFSASLLSCVIGTLVGIISGYLGKVADVILGRATEIMMVLPGVPFMIVLAAILGPSLLNIIFVIAITGWTRIARVVRSQVLSLKERTFVEASEGIGAGRLHVIFHHIFPNVWQLVLYQLIVGVMGAILSEAGLSFLGLGDPRVNSWGMILHDATISGALARRNWWYFVPPGICISLVTIAFAFIGYAVDEIVNPRLRGR